ncbi:uncharacterized protein LOC136040353 [Artemia franciscana]|uniref:uncharacterized protein LOC136040353 n=1 Tax=Artemia franciscana TaxID=6661 RepID=UPI0032D9C954
MKEILILFFCGMVAPGKVSYKGYQVTRAVTRNREQVQILANLYENGKYDFWSPPRIGNVDIMVSEEEIPELEAILREADIPYHVQIQDVGKLQEEEDRAIAERQKQFETATESSAENKL